MVDQQNPTQTRPQTHAEMVAQASQSGTVVIDGMRYAVGLMWLPLQNLDDPIPEIRETMDSEPGADYYCLRTGAAPQYGIAKSSMGHMENEPSLAAAVASALSDKTSVCAVFKVDEGYWFVAIRNDLILSEEDILFHTEEEAKRAFFSMMAVPDWGIKIVPASWHIEGTEERDLAALIKNSRKVRLVELSTAKKTQILLFVSLVILALLGGAVYLIYSLIKVAWTPETIPVMPTPEVVKPVEPVIPKAKPWEKVVQVDALLSRCWNNTYQLTSVFIPWWKMGTVVCTPSGIQTTWTRTGDPGKRLAWLKYAIKDYQFNRLEIKPISTTQAEGKLPFADMPMISTAPTLTVEQLQEELHEITDATGMPIAFSEQTVLDPPNNADGSAPPNQQVYHFFSFTINSEYTPWEWKTFFDKFTGLELLKLEYAPGNQNKWKYEGRIYAK